MPKWIVLMVALLLPPLQPAQAQNAAPASTPSAVTVTIPDVRQATPGDYVTLTFMVSGQGEYDLNIDGGADWIPVTRTRKVKLNGSTLVPVSFRVPNMAPVGPSPTLTLQLSAAGQVVTTAQTHVEVLQRAKVAIRAPAELTGTSNQRVNYQIEVTNLGNQADTVELKVTNVDEFPKLSDTAVYLQPGESKTVGVSLNAGDSSPGYQYIAFLEAISRNNQSARARTRTLVVFNPAHFAGFGKQNGPQLTFGIRAGVEGAVNWSPDGRSTYLRYGVQPKVTGQLSDYAKGEAGLSGLEGSSERWVPQGVAFGVHIESVRWDLDAALSLSGAAATANIRRGDWTFSPRLGFASNNPDTKQFSGGLTVEGPLLGGRIEAIGGSNYLLGQLASVRTDLLSVRYKRDFSPRLALSVGSLANGQSVNGVYTGSALGYEEVTYNTPTFDVTQSYSGTLGGYHTLGVSGGLRATQPFGVRGAALVQYTPRGIAYSTSGQLSYTARNGFGLSLGGRFQQGSTGDLVAPWGVVAGIKSPRLVWRNVSAAAAAIYTVSPSPSVSGAYFQQVNSSATLQVGPLSTSALGLWTREPQPGGLTYDKVQLNLSSIYQWPSGDSLSATYDFERRQEVQLSSSQSVQASWSRQWTPRLSTQLDYRRSWLTDPTGTRTPESVGVSAGLSNVLTPGLSLRAGYYVNAPNGLLNGNLGGNVRLALNYDAAWAFNTPPAIVKLMGGRKGGELKGVLYRDDNFNNQRDAGESGLSGVTIEVGKEKAVSGPDGSYSIRVPTGTYDLKFPAGLPATLEALEDNSVDVKENSSTALNVAFAPVAHAEVLVFNDLNRDGVKDDNEGVLPYTGVTFSGPVTREVQADGRGYARVSTLPAGRYTISVNPKQLPEGFTPTTGGTQLELRGGQTAPSIELGAALPPKQSITTYTAGNIALIGSVTPNTTVPGSKVKVTVYVQNASSLTIEAFGQSYTPVLTAGRADLELAVPANTAAGTYDITVTATQGTNQKISVVKLLLLAPVGTAAKGEGGKP